MATQNKTYTRAIRVIPSDNADVPNPALQILSGTSNPGASSPFFLVGAISFDNLGIQPGDIVYNTSSNLSATIISYPIGGNLLELNADIFTATGENFIIYAGTQNDASQGGCVIYCGAGGGFTADTVSGDQVVLSSLTNGQTVPIQVKKVYATGISASGLVALW